MKYDIPKDCQIPFLEQIYQKYFNKLGTFVEVGAFDGHTHSNTCFLADMGWCGVYIEPVEEYLQKCKDRHKKNNCIFVNSLVGNDFEKDFFVAGEWSTNSIEIKKDIEKFFGVKFSEPIKVKSRSLNSILEENNIKNFDLLVVDCEGAELEILKNFDIQKYKPKLCILELHEQYTPMWHNENHLNNLNEINKIMINNGYQKIYYDEINSIFCIK
jgi:FkbM family methyltransferase